MTQLDRRPVQVTSINPISITIRAVLQDVTTMRPMIAYFQPAMLAREMPVKVILPVISQRIQKFDFVFT